MMEYLIDTITYDDFENVSSWLHVPVKLLEESEEKFFELANKEIEDLGLIGEINKIVERLKDLYPDYTNEDALMHALITKYAHIRHPKFEAKKGEFKIIHKVKNRMKST